MAQQNLEDILKLANVAVQMQNAQRGQDSDIQTAMAYLAQQQNAEQNSAQLGLNERQLEAGTKNAELAAMVDFIRSYAGTVGADPQRLLEMGTAIPGMEGPIAQGDERMVGNQLSSLLPGIESVYAANQRTPEKINPVLDTLLAQAGIGWGSEAVNRVDWQGLNQRTWPGEPQPSTQTSGTSQPVISDTPTGRAGAAVRGAGAPAARLMQNVVWNTPGMLANLVSAPANFVRSVAGMEEAFPYHPITDLQEQDPGRALLALLQNPSGRIDASAPRPSAAPQTPLLQSNQPLNISDIVRRNR